MQKHKMSNEVIYQIVLEEEGRITCINYDTYEEAVGDLNFYNYKEGKLLEIILDEDGDFVSEKLYFEF